jgi:hypothetical protein
LRTFELIALCKAYKYILNGCGGNMLSQHAAAVSRLGQQSTQQASVVRPLLMCAQSEQCLGKLSQTGLTPAELDQGRWAFGEQMPCYLSLGADDK